MHRSKICIATARQNMQDEGSNTNQVLPIRRLQCFAFGQVMPASPKRYRKWKTKTMWLSLPQQENLLVWVCHPPWQDRQEFDECSKLCNKENNLVYKQSQDNNKDRGDITFGRLLGSTEHILVEWREKSKCHVSPAMQMPIQTIKSMDTNESLSMFGALQRLLRPCDNCKAIIFQKQWEDERKIAYIAQKEYLQFSASCWISIPRPFSPFMTVTEITWVTREIVES